MSELTKGFLSDMKKTIDHLPRSRCRNCKRDLRLYEGRWFHIEMAGGHYFQAHGCNRAYPQRCVGCGARIDYKTTDPSYYNFKCQSCIKEHHKNDKIGNLSDDLRQQLELGNHPRLKYGTCCAVVLTKYGIFFEDIC